MQTLPACVGVAKLHRQMIGLEPFLQGRSLGCEGGPIFHIHGGRLRLAVPESNTQARRQEHGEAVDPEDNFGFAKKLLEAGQHELIERIPALHGGSFAAPVSAKLLGTLRTCARAGVLPKPGDQVDKETIGVRLKF